MYTAAQLAQNKVEFDLMCANFGITEFAQYVQQHNTAKLNPYHNTPHCFGVAHLAFRIGAYDPCIISSMSSLRGMLVGCLFHDFDHTGKNVADLENIERALLGLKAAQQETDKPLSETEYETAQRCIRVTEFPFVRVPETIEERIIRDADLLYVTTHPNHLIVLRGLHSEMSANGKTSQTFEEFLPGNDDFMDSCTFYTHAGKTMFEALRDIIKCSHVAFLEEKR